MKDRDELLALADRLKNAGLNFGDQSDPCSLKVTVPERDTIVSALRLAALSPEPVAWRWRFEDQSAWTVSKKRPLHADDRDVICEPLYTAPPRSASDGALREALERLKQGIRDIAQACVDGRVCDDVAWFTEIPAETLFDKCCNLLGEDLPTRQSAPAASEATKSDGGVFDECAASGQSCIYAGNGPNGEFQCIYCGKPGPSDTIYGGFTPITVGASSAPSDTRPADVTVCPHGFSHPRFCSTCNGY